MDDLKLRLKRPSSHREDDKPPRRRRRLTLTSDDDPPAAKILQRGSTTAMIPRRFTRQQTYDQLQSPLFKLPYELRELIWRAALTGRSIQLFYKMVSKKSQFYHKLMKRMTMPTRYIDVERQEETGFPPGRYTALSLLLSCRRMYV